MEDLSQLPPKTQNLIHLEKTKRQKTWGEKAFDWGTYGGIALLGNEAASLVITHQAKSGKGFLGEWYTGFKNFFMEMKPTKYLPQSAKEYITEGRLPFLLTACIGGMLIVFPVKALEDRKGQLVRKLDTWRHGAKAETEPHMVEAHEEMDKAPKQSWGSLWKGRAITVVSATLADYAFGWSKSITGRLLKGTAAEKFASLDHISEQAGIGLPKLLKIKPEKQAIAKTISEEATWLLTLSGSLTVLFYVTSKMFAKEGAENKERKAEKRAHATTNHTGSDETNELAPTSATPSLKITRATYDQPLAQAQQAAQLS